MITIKHYAFTTKQRLTRGQVLINFTKPFNLNVTGEVFQILFTIRLPNVSIWLIWVEKKTTQTIKWLESIHQILSTIEIGQAIITSWIHRFRHVCYVSHLPSPLSFHGQKVNFWREKNGSTLKQRYIKHRAIWDSILKTFQCSNWRHLNDNLYENWCYFSYFIIICCGDSMEASQWRIFFNTTYKPYLLWMKEC